MTTQIDLPLKQQPFKHLRVLIEDTKPANQGVSMTTQKKTRKPRVSMTPANFETCVQYYISKGGNTSATELGEQIGMTPTGVSNWMDEIVNEGEKRMSKSAPAKEVGIETTIRNKIAELSLQIEALKSLLPKA